ncbi:chromosome segregation in meiosis- protein [Entomortierella chlamydospora]|uniref:Chromosome segregation in meiosis protein n=1 Tax=Entomortierella chlamydospora TaxID=101097 RepID=A0A9P6N314_9FUNG|nr:chromosome segregation in meiosis- protein [Entomortierella chlamydospora]
MDDIPLEDEPFEPFDDYEDYADQMMHEAERQDQLITNATTSNSAPSSSSAPKNLAHFSDALPEQRDFLGMLQTQNLQTEQELQRFEQQRRQQQEQQQKQQQQGQWQSKKGSGRTIGSGGTGTGGGGGGGDEAGGDLGAVTVAKKRVKIVTLDNERLMGEHGLPLLMSNGKRFKIRHKYKDSAEKNMNAKNNIADLMRLYQTWAHNLFPKATFKDFISKAESKCRSDRQIRSTMDGWRDAYWKQVMDEKNAKEAVDRAEQEALDRQNGVWEEHEKELEAQESSSASKVTSANGVSSPSESAQRPKPAASKKGKERASDNPFASTAMRMVASDDEEDQEDYERALNRMRISMNLDNRNGQASGTSPRRHQRHASNEDQFIFGAGGPIESATRKNEIDLDNYNSDVEDDDDDAPLFTHRALQMMGKSKSSEILSTNIPALDKPAPIAEGSSRTNGSIDSDQEDMSALLNTPTIELDPSLSMSTLPLDTFGSNDSNDIISLKMEGVQSMDAADDDGGDDILTRRKPTKGRRAILLDSSDEE